MYVFKFIYLHNIYTDVDRAIVFGRWESLLHAEHHVDPLHDEVLVGVVGLVFGRNFKHRGNHLVVVPQNVADVVRYLHTNIHTYIH